MFDIYSLRFTFQLSPQLGDVLYLLVTQKFVTIEELHAIFSNPRVGMYRLRQAVTPYGIDVQVRNMLGYFLTDETKQAVIDIVNKTMDPSSEPVALEEDADAPA